ncbi:MAG: alpha/beta family hydrolase [Deltaproteobacteria bacterium]|nr:alpha/beta family hydrolase [Deltaproteobacteria bacterium]
MAVAFDARRFAVGDASVSGAVHRAAPPALGVTVVVAHGAGTRFDHPFLVAFADGLARHGVDAVRFNFPYTERGGRAPDPAPVLEACYRSVLEAVRADAVLGAGRLVIGGKSMGGRMASHLAAAGAVVDGLLFLGYPLHPAGQPHKLRAAHLPRISAPMLFLTGTRDALCPLERLRAVLATVPRAALHVVDDADHAFAVRKRSGRDAAAVMSELIEASLSWVRGEVAAAR